MNEVVGDRENEDVGSLVNEVVTKVTIKAKGGKAKGSYHRDQLPGQLEDGHLMADAHVVDSAHYPLGEDQ